MATRDIVAQLVKFYHANEKFLAHSKLAMSWRITWFLESTCEAFRGITNMSQIKKKKKILLVFIHVCQGGSVKEQ